MGPAPNLTVASKAYLKIYFHAAKHLHQTINGVLLGNQTGGKIVVEDAIPLLHHWTSLSPMMEIGLDLAEQYAAEANLKIVGYYQGRAAVGDVGLGPVGEKITQRIKEKFADAFALTLDGEDFGTEKAALVVWTYTENQWRRIGSSGASPPFTSGSSIQLDSPDLPQKALSYVRDKSLHLQFGDFDDHLEDVKIDWIHNRECIPVE
ncbi:hypothetical protein CC1G_05032 [Coprinopsis cinerea okayama7|uniref:MPN domain-containing protein n=1 Tax=Coprinopsis cinerea (strain Okayama-7 / 130 / ATCC MYA-4618 / FGSC 9003) TaxID=240176 RepID=A8NSL7_COPC7|nr:hypothetical protein CC1G_05032 [Coprinopsis cinerea okayama7\|eukprot:XP_001836039.1 hypothetical protein CC1G_05032 [Coprinopsis cinerea okayama7\